MFGYDTYLAPTTWRYGSEEMRKVWSELHRREAMREVWCALASAQHEAGLVSAEQLADLEANKTNINIDRALEIEKETRHDVMAEIRSYGEVCPVGGGIIHWGATSADINDNVYAVRLHEAANIIEKQLRELLAVFAQKIEETSRIPVMAHTHIQPAEPTTLGYRFAVYAQDLLDDLDDLQRLIGKIRGKGFKGAVGTQSSYEEILHGTGTTVEQMEASAMAKLGIPYFPIATQTYTRQQDLRIVQVLAGIGASLHKFAMDFRVLQSPPFGEWAEPFGKKQVGSSAMPFKRNPINMENICSLARMVASHPGVMWDNASQAILERSLDDSANRRFIFPDAFLATNEMLRRMIRVVGDMRLDEKAMQRNMSIYGPFAATEKVLMVMVGRGASRQDGHEWIREASLTAWAALRETPGQNPLTELLQQDPNILQYLKPEEIPPLMDASTHLGTAPQRAEAMAATVRATLG